MHIYPYFTLLLKMMIRNLLSCVKKCFIPYLSLLFAIKCPQFLSILLDEKLLHVLTFWSKRSLSGKDNQVLTVIAQV